MKTLANNGRLLASSAIIILAVAVILAVIIESKNAALKKMLNTEKLRSEALLSEKLSIDKKIADMTRFMDELKGKNSSMDVMIRELKEQLSSKEQEVNRLMANGRENKMLNVKLAELRKIIEETEKQMAEVLKRSNDLDSQNQELKMNIAALQEENLALKNQNAILLADNFRVESQKRKSGTLTAFAKRTKKLVTTFEVPPSHVSNINFKVTLPDGIQVSEKSKAISWVVTDRNDKQELASLTGNGIQVSKQITMTYNPGEKFKKGIYKVEMYNDGIYIGSCQIRMK